MNWEDIRAEFELTDISLKDLAEKHGIKPATLRSRKNREKWEKNGSQQKNATQRKDATRNATQHKNVATQKAIEQLDENSELSDQQKQFCLNYLKWFNATKAYQEAYGCGYDSARNNGSRLLAKDSVQAELRRLKEAQRFDLMVEVSDINRQWVKQAFADVTDFVEFKKEMEANVDEDGNIREVETFKFSLKDSDKIDGTLVKEIRMTRDGPTIKLYDSQKALEMLQKRLLSFDEIALDSTRANTELTRAKTQLIKGAEHDTSMMQVLLDVLKEGDDDGEEEGG